MALIQTETLGPSGGCAVRVEPGQRLRVVDVTGRQVVDMAVFNGANPREKLSTSYSRSRFDPKALQESEEGFHPRDKLMIGDYLMSTINNEMMRITADTARVEGMHDAHGRMCNRRLYQTMGVTGPDGGEKDGCHEIIAAAMAPHGVLPEDIPDTFDLFMNYHHDCEKGWWVIEEGVSDPGDFIEFEAVMDCIVALSNCPFYDGTEIRVEVIGG
jgi:uncharacterized protein YcgI (DUF1989 family)